MSRVAQDWAWLQTVKRASDRLTLLCLADHANVDKQIAFPSIERISLRTSLDKKTIIAAIDRLEKTGLISESGRTGRTRQVKRYKLHVERGPQPEQFQNRNSSRNSSKAAQKRVQKTVTGTKDRNGVDNFQRRLSSRGRITASSDSPLAIGSLTTGLAGFAMANAPEE